MTRAELLTEITTLTDRPDLATEIASMLVAATLRMHHSDFYARDLSETQIDLGSSGYTFSFANTTFVRYRALHYLRYTDGTTAGKVYSPLDIGRDGKNVIDIYGRDKNDVWYAAGSNIVLRSSTTVRYLLAGWYQNPDTSVATYSSWIADLVPHAIIFDACSLIFQMIGQQEQSRKFDALVKEQLQAVQMHGLLSRGY